jgi:RimJ/RimL family protein N-acetyltransferase
MTSLTTRRLRLREWTFDDADFVLDLYSRWEVQRFIGREPRVMRDRDEAVARITRGRAIDEPEHGIWAVEHAETGRLLGTLLLKSIPASGAEDPLLPSGDTEIGWHLHPESWGHGYASEAAAAVLRHAFATGLSEVVAVTHPDNTASQAVCRRLGMTHVGQTDRYYDVRCELFVASAADQAASPG